LTFTDSATVNTTYTIAAGTYTANIAGISNGDVLDFPDGINPTVNNANFTDGNVDLQWALSGNVVTIHLTGLTTAIDGASFDLASFETAVGSNGTVI
jgi:hypothetical protein